MVDVLTAMKVFVKVAEANSYAHAAETLEMGVPRISRVITELEEHLGTRLLQRTTRKMSMTEAGRIYLDRCRQILGEVEETYSMLSTNAISTSGRLRIVAPALFAMRQLGPILSAYQREYPNVIVDLALVDRAVDLIEEEFDLGILAARHVTAQTLVSRHLTSTDYYTCASPDYIARNGAPAHPTDLISHPYVSFRTSQATDEIVFNAPDGTAVSAAPKPTLYTNNIGMVRECVLAGLGIATLSAYLVEDDIRTGKLTRLLPEYSLPDREFRIVYSNRKFLPLKVKAFVDMAVDHFRESAKGMRPEASPLPSALR
ncbi:LysR family transcriptional regulator [Paraburkholderia sp. BCC1885]|uniref:LysR family transcriptional regulator n=1 Tax=Paraburkholderia sp. BCC1885 TaxID=2562669 RepID=UPI001182FC4E|nr:LysR family transcriptional regulator [Paraburkholderia sp. BCC1885]